MRENMLEQFRKDYDEFDEKTDQFYRKEISVAEYKSFSGGFGSYAQRGGEKSMLRLRFTGGEITMEKLGFIVDSIKKYNIDLLHLTTCETIQLHNLEKETVCTLAKEALECGIITRGGGGDFPRNVMCSPLSGVQPGEAFDVFPYAEAAGEYLLTLIGKMKLPRKLKVCFSNGTGNEVHATCRDLGFVATPEGKFDVYAAGGLGIQPKFGVKVAEKIEPDQILYCIKTMVDVFVRYGDYENRGRARTRFLQDKLTPEGFVQIYRDKLDENLQNEKLTVQVESAVITKTGMEDQEFVVKNHRVTKQKQKGLYAVNYHPTGGTPAPAFMISLYELLKDMEQVKIRLSPDQGIYVINLNKEEALKVLELTKKDQGTLFERSTACIGADICQVGIGKSQALLKACMEKVREEQFADGVLPAIHISGCPSSCAAHQTAALGFRGGKKKTENGSDFAFALFENGTEKLGEERFGKELGVMFEKDIPDFLVELGRAVADKDVSYEVFRDTYPEQFMEIVDKYV